MAFSAKASNCSQDCICFESKVNLSSGTAVFIAAEGDFRQYRAEVKWSEKLEKTDPERYTVGAEYTDPL